MDAHTDADTDRVLIRTVGLVQFGNVTVNTKYD